MNAEMELTAAALANRVIGGGEVTAEELLAVLKNGRREDLFEAAHRVTEAFKADHFDFCAILNARSGKCSENCKWCAQSAHWKTSCDVWTLKTADACVAAAKEAEANGAVRFALVTSGRSQSAAEVEEIGRAHV